MKRPQKRQIEKHSGILCLECGEILVSWHRHDFNGCGCENKTFVDGGYAYLRYGGKELSKIQIVNLSFPDQEEDQEETSGQTQD